MTLIPPDSGVTLAMLIDDWLRDEGIVSFYIKYPREDDTVMVGFIGWMMYDHSPDGHSTLISIYDKRIYLDYEDVWIEATDPDFFVKLKSALRKHEAIHASCKHIRGVND